MHLCLIYFLIQVSVYGVVFALPSQVERLLGKAAGFEVGLVTAGSRAGQGLAGRESRSPGHRAR